MILTDDESIDEGYDAYLPFANPNDSDSDSSIEIIGLTDDEEEEIPLDVILLNPDIDFGS